MQKKFCCFIGIFLALSSMPLNIFGAEHYGTKMFKGNGFGDFEDWVADTFCNSSSMEPLYNFGCGLTQYIQCTQAYKQEVRNKDSNLYKSLQNVLSVFAAACNDNSGQILNNFDSIETNGVNFTGIVCQSGYTHPDSSVSLYKYRCIKQSSTNSGKSATATNIGSTDSGNGTPYATVSPAVASTPRAATPVQSAPMPKATINDQADLRPESAKQTLSAIAASIKTVKPGDSITYESADYKKYLQLAIKEWEKACDQSAKKMYSPNAVTDSEAVTIDSRKGTQKMTCYIESCGRDDLKVSNNRKSCEQTKEAKKFDKEIQKKSEEVQKVIDKINASASNIKIGASITIPANMNYNNNVTTAKEAWADRCVAIRNDTVKEASIDYSPDGNTLTCVITECTQKTSGYYPSNNGLKCEQTKEGKKTEKKLEEVQKLIDKINTSASNIKIGASITVPANMNYNDNVTTAKEAWADRCVAIRNDTVKEASIDYSPDGNTLTCVIVECKQPGYDPDNKGLKCEQTTEEKQRIKEQERENEKDRCGGRDGSWDDKKGCLCNGRKMPKGDSQCVSPDAKKYKAGDNGQSIVESINASKNKIKIGSSISVNTRDKEFYDKVDTAISEWEQACDNLSDAEKSVVSNDQVKGDKTVYTCLIQTCKQSGYSPNSKKTKCELSSEVCNASTNAKWKSGKCVCTDSKYTWDPEELECIIPADKPYKKACEEQEGGKWVTRGNTSTCACPDPGELWNRSTKTCRVEDDEEEEEIKATPSAYESQKPFLEEGTEMIKQQFIIYKLLKEGSPAQKENEAEFAEWKKTCADVGRQNHVKTTKIVTDVNPETNVYRWHNCVADTCEEGYENPSPEWPVCQKDEDVKPGKKCTVSYGKGVGTYDENKKCKLTDCEGKNYTLNEDKNKCELNTTANIRNNKIEKAFIADVKKLISAFDAMFDKYLSECETSGKEIKDGQCVEKSNEGQS